MEWISVEDRLPPTNTIVLAAAICQYTNNPIPECFTAYMDNCGNRRVWVLFGSGSAEYSVTYWMPIPEPPNGRK